METAGKKRSFFEAFDQGVVFVLRAVCVICLTMLLLLLSGNVFVRFVPVMAFYWFDEVVEWTFAWMVFMGAAALWARNEHFRLEWINDKIKGTPKGHLVAAVLEVVSLFFLTVFTYQAWRLTCLAHDWTPVFNVPRKCLYICMPISGVIMVAYSIRNIVREVLAFLNLRAGGQPLA